MIKRELITHSETVHINSILLNTIYTEEYTIRFFGVRIYRRVRKSDYKHDPVDKYKYEPTRNPIGLRKDN